MNTLSGLVDFGTYVLEIFKYGLIAQAVLSWLVAFNVVNTYNGFVRGVMRALDTIYDPLLRPIRRLLPDMGGIDFSPMILILLIMLVEIELPALLRDAGVLR